MVAMMMIATSFTSCSDDDDDDNVALSASTLEGTWKLTKEEVGPKNTRSSVVTDVAEESAALSSGTYSETFIFNIDECSGSYSEFDDGDNDMEDLLIRFPVIQF